MVLAFIQAIIGIVLILFIPGYALSLVLYPGREEISIIERTGFSIVLSMGVVILIVLFIDEVLAFNTTPVNIVFATLIFSIIALCVWEIELILKRYFTRRVFSSLLVLVKGGLKSQNFDSIEQKMEEER
jgi:uncharacterized membrane protein